MAAILTICALRPPDKTQAWADQVARLSNGTVKIDFKNGRRSGHARNEADTVGDLRAGNVDHGAARQHERATLDAPRRQGGSGTFRVFRDKIELVDDGDNARTTFTWSLRENRLILSDMHPRSCDGEAIFVPHSRTRVRS